MQIRSAEWWTSYYILYFQLKQVFYRISDFLMKFQPKKCILKPIQLPLSFASSTRRL